jgi:hypothetical protein
MKRLLSISAAAAIIMMSITEAYACRWDAFETNVKLCLAPLGGCGDNNSRCRGQQTMNRAVDANDAGLLDDGFEICQSDNSAAKKSGRNCINEDGRKALGIASRYRRS